MDDMKVRLEQNQAEVIKEITHIGRTTYVNIVTGVRTDVEWGAGEWFSAIALGGLGVLLFGIIFGLVGLAVAIATGIIH